MNSKNDVERGQRLREERKRLGFIQKTIALEVGIGEVAWVNYEKGTRAPDQRLLEQLYLKGFDVLYLVTGTRTLTDIAPDEQALLQSYRHIAPKDRLTVQSVVKTYATAHGLDSEKK